MKFRSFGLALVCFGVQTLSPTTSWASCPGPSCPSISSDNDRIFNEIVGAAAGAVLLHQFESQKLKQRKLSVTPNSTEGREATRNIQTALNYFGFDAGVVDGLAGPKTRKAISSYQAFRGQPVTGVLSLSDQVQLLQTHRIALNEEQGETAIADRRLALERAIASIEGNRVTALAAVAPQVQPSPTIQSAPENEGIRSICEKVKTRESLEKVLGVDASTTAEVELDLLIERRLCELLDSVNSKASEIMASNPSLTFQKFQASCQQLSTSVGNAADSKWRTSPSVDVIEVIKASISPQTSERSGAWASVCTLIGYREGDEQMILMSSILGAASGNIDQTEAVGLVMAIQDAEWMKSRPVLSWFDLAYSASDPINSSYQDELRSRILAIER